MRRFAIFIGVIALLFASAMFCAGRKDEQGRTDADRKEMQGKPVAWRRLLPPIVSQTHDGLSRIYSGREEASSGLRSVGQAWPALAWADRGDWLDRFERALLEAGGNEIQGADYCMMFVISKYWRLPDGAELHIRYGLSGPPRTIWVEITKPATAGGSSSG
jgi:hypothetical protein